MTLITAHKILIGTAIGLFVIYGLWELNGYLNNGDRWAAARAAIGFLVAFGWGIYYRTIKSRRPKPPQA